MLMRDSQTHHLLTHEHVYKVKVVITSSCQQNIFESLAGTIQSMHAPCKTIAQEGFMGKHQAKSDVTLFSLQNHSTLFGFGFVFSAKLSICRWVLACLLTSLSPFVTCQTLTSDILHFFNLSDLITGHHELLLGWFLSSLQSQRLCHHSPSSPQLHFNMHFPNYLSALALKPITTKVPIFTFLTFLFVFYHLLNVSGKCNEQHDFLKYSFPLSFQ